MPNRLVSTFSLVLMLVVVVFVVVVVAVVEDEEIPLACQTPHIFLHHWNWLEDTVSAFFPLHLLPSSGRGKPFDVLL